VCRRTTIKGSELQPFRVLRATILNTCGNSVNTCSNSDDKDDTTNTTTDEKVSNSASHLFYLAQPPCTLPRPRRLPPPLQTPPLPIPDTPTNS